MEDLNKNQLILLALLVSFVTSIATGVVTVSLMEQAPQSVTQTINKVVTQTIEKVTKEPALVIRATEEDLITSAVDENSKGIVKIRLGAEGDTIGSGIVLSSDGMIASDVNPGEFAEEAEYFVVFSDGKELPLTYLKLDKSGISFFSTALGDDKKTAYVPTKLSLGDSDKAKLGQTVLVISPSGDLQKGIISGLVRDITTEGTTTEAVTDTTNKEVKTVKLIKVSVVISKDNSGSPLIDLNGNVLGITLYKDGVRVVVPVNMIKQSLAEITAPKK